MSDLEIRKKNNENLSSAAYVFHSTERLQHVQKRKTHVQNEGQGEQKRQVSTKSLLTIIPKVSDTITLRSSWTD